MMARLRILVWHFLLLLIIGFYPAVSQAQEESIYTTIKDVRSGTSNGVTRFVIEAQRPLPYHIFTLADPNRVVVDIPEVDWQGVRARPDHRLGVMQGYRIGLFKPGVMRLVIDLSKAAKVSQHFRIERTSEVGPRLVIDLVEDQGAQKIVTLASDDWSAYQADNDRQQARIAPVTLQQRKDRPMIVIDPGHGGVDPGAIGQDGTYEKDIVLPVSRALAKALQNTGRYDAHLTRSRDLFIPLRKRYEAAHKVNGDLFLSLHADSHAKASLRGLSIYTLSDRASDAEAAALARKENKSDIIAGTNLDEFTPEVSSILIDLAQQSVNQSSWHLAEMLVDRLSPKVRMLSSPHRFAGFAVLKSPKVPSVLIELGYLSNREDTKNLKSDAYRKKVMEGVIQALDLYFERQERLEGIGS